jgi:hypothetical protein
MTGLLVFLAGAIALYLLVVLPLTWDENPLGKVVVVAPTLDATLAPAKKRQRVVAVVRRWERGWNGTKGEQRCEPDAHGPPPAPPRPPDAEGRIHFPPATVKSWAARVVPHEPVTEQWLYVVTREGGEEVEDPEPLWEHLHRSYEDHPLELRIKL